MAVLHYKELVAWQRAMELARVVYRETKCIPDSERFGLTNQLRRAAVSVPSNIAEGQGRGIGREFAHHLRIANGSRQEVETQILLAESLGFVSGESCRQVCEACDEVGRLLSGLLRSITTAET